MTNHLYMTAAITLAAALSFLPALAQEGAQEGDAPQEGTLAAEISELAQGIKLCLGDDDELSYRTFEGDTLDAPQDRVLLKDVNGTVIQKMLTDELKKVGISNSRSAQLTCKGTCFFDKDACELLVELQLMDGRVVKKTFERAIYNMDDVFAVKPITKKLSPDPRERADVIAAGVTEKSTPVILTKAETVEKDVALTNTAKVPNAGQIPADTGVRVTTEKQSAYGMEIYVKDPQGGYAVLPVSQEESGAFADLGLGSIYAVKLINGTGRPAAVALTIDGLNIFAFSQIDPYRRLGTVIIPEKSAGLIKGWHVSNTVSAEFEVSEFADSAVAKVRGTTEELKFDSKIGAITATFRFGYRAGEPVAPDEVASKSMATKVGNAVDMTYRPSNVVNAGMIREIITIRYVRALPPPN